MSPGLVLRLGLAVLCRPRLWGTALRQVHRLAPRGWWRRPPFLPLPDSGYQAFRQVTQYGDAAHPPDVADVLVWLEWCRTLPAAVAAGNEGASASGAVDEAEDEGASASGAVDEARTDRDPGGRGDERAGGRAGQ